MQLNETTFVFHSDFIENLIKKYNSEIESNQTFLHLSVDEYNELQEHSTTKVMFFCGKRLVDPHLARKTLGLGRKLKRGK